MRHRLAALLFAALVLVLAAFTGTSLAGNGHGNGGGNDQGQQQASTQSSAAQAASTDQHGNSGSKQSDTSASNPATGGSNAQGVKPDSTTKHDTYAAASSNQTKVYGNGKTAGQIATQAGDGGAILHGPGNSQPHKTAPCPGGHEVDVHALKHKGGTCAQSTTSASSSSSTQSSQSTNTSSSTTSTVTSSTTSTVTSSTTNTQVAAVTPSTSSVTATPATTGSVLGATATLKAKPKAKPAGGVLGTTTRLGGTVGSSRLPFTGLSLWMYALIAAGLIGAGLFARRAAADHL